MLHFPGVLCSVQLKCYIFQGFVLNATKHATFSRVFVLNATKHATISRVFERAAHWDRQTYPEGAPVPS